MKGAGGVVDRASLDLQPLSVDPSRCRWTLKVNFGPLVTVRGT